LDALIITFANSAFAKAGVAFSAETFLQGSTAVILLNFYAKNPPLRQARNDASQLSKLIHEKITKNIVSILGNFCYLCGDV